MLVTAYKTKKITVGDNIFAILKDSLPKDLPEKSVVAISSKIIALCEGRVADPEKEDRDELAKKEADWYLPREDNPFDVMVTITNNTFIASAGIDKSNADGQYVLLPKDVQRSANNIRAFLKKEYNRKEIGVIITDSHLLPLRWGVTGVALAHSGFNAKRSYIGKEDVFGRSMQVEMVNDADSLAAAAVNVMGEGAEQTPLAVITDISYVTFVDKDPTGADSLPTMIDMHHEVFTPLLMSAPWKKGKGEN